MSYKRDFTYRKKIIGGSIIGNLWDAGKNALYTLGKAALSKEKELFDFGSKKAIEIGKEIVKKGAEDLKDYATVKVSDIAEKGVQNIIEKAKSQAKTVSNKLSPKMRETIKTIATNPKVKKIITDKTKEVLTKMPIVDKSRAILDNIIMGTGVKRLK